jgi:hypothetical protein
MTNYPVKDIEVEQEVAPISLRAPGAAIELSAAGSFRGGGFSSSTPTAPGYDPETHRLFVGSEDCKGIDVIDITNPATPTRIAKIDLRPYGGEPQDLDLHDGLLAITIKRDADDPLRPEKLLLLDARFEVEDVHNVESVVDPIDIPGAGRPAFTPQGDKIVVTQSGPVLAEDLDLGGLIDTEDLADVPGVLDVDDVLDLEGGIAIVDLEGPGWRNVGDGSEATGLSRATTPSGRSTFSRGR